MTQTCRASRASWRGRPNPSWRSPSSSPGWPDSGVYDRRLLGTYGAQRPYRNVRNPPIKGATVSGTDKVKNAMQDVEGKTKEAMGKVTGNRRQENQGRA